MTFRPDSVRGAPKRSVSGPGGGAAGGSTAKQAGRTSAKRGGSGGGPTPAVGGQSGTIDYRLARRHLIAEYHRGRLSRVDVCDAHPELLRAAQHVGAARDEACPICEEQQLVDVSYVFGGRLPAHGRCITNRSELTKIDKQSGSYACYVVEVCPGCRWNHLARTYPLGRSNAG